MSANIIGSGFECLGYIVPYTNKRCTVSVHNDRNLGAMQQHYNNIGDCSELTDK